MKIEFKDKVLTVDNIQVSFSHPIREIIKSANGVIVRLGSFSDIERNVFFVNLDGSIKWQIAHLGLPEKAGYQGYTYIGFDKDGILEADSFRGIRCKVNIETGDIYNCIGDRG